MRATLVIVYLVCCSFYITFAQKIMVEGVEREFILKTPVSKAPDSGYPFVLFFHGHGGNMRHAAQKFQFEKEWAEAVVIYMQGLPGVAGKTDPEGVRSGWQMNPGQLNDRDVKFFDAVLNEVQRRFSINPDRVFIIGHSNGARFCNVLWNKRPDKIRAICSAAAQGGDLLQNAPPRSVFHIAGEKDPIVPFAGQMLSITFTRKLLQTDTSKAKILGFARLEPGINGTEWAAYLHPGGHEFPEKSIPLVMKFFQRLGKP